MIKGIIFNIQKFAIYDGPGIRTIIFMKGCPLRCIWCQNPEGLMPHPQLCCYERLCIHCHACIQACPKNAIIHNVEDTHIINREICDMCGECVEECPTGALGIIGKEITVKDLIEEIQRDIKYFDSSEGGVTFSGGEPLFQAEFLYETLKECRELGIHTAIETSGYSSQEVIQKISKYVNLFLYDIKIVDEETHRKYTGVSNRLILNNLRSLVLNVRGKDIIIRIPLVPTITDSNQNINNIVGLLVSLKDIEEVHLLPFHDVYEKYKSLGMPYTMTIHEPPNDDRIRYIKDKFVEQGFTVSLWGVK